MQILARLCKMWNWGQSPFPHFSLKSRYSLGLFSLEPYSTHSPDSLMGMATLWHPYGNPMATLWVEREKSGISSKEERDCFIHNLRCVAVVAVVLGIIDNAKINCNDCNATVNSLFLKKLSFSRNSWHSEKIFLHLILVNHSGCQENAKRLFNPNLPYLNRKFCAP